jgi:hypothetical protein
MKVRLTDQEKEVLETDGIYLVRDDCSEVKPFISPADSDEMRELKRRCIYALRHSSHGHVENQASAMLAGAIDHLRAARKDQGRVWSSIERKAFIKSEAAWLAPGLLEAAENGSLSEIARLLDRWRRDGRVANQGQHRVVVAYMNVLARENRPPLINELLRQLKIDKPNRTKDSMQEWLRVNSRERVIRETLKQFDLPLSAGKRGRPSQRRY